MATSGDKPRSSSLPRDAAADAVVWNGTGPTGPVRLPAEQAERFVAEFNRQYGPLGWTMNPAREQPPK